jgi:hypothetical protein
MSHYAQVKEGIVRQVIVADQDFIDILPDKDDWYQTSYNTRGNVHYAPNSNTPDDEPPLRGNYAGTGYIYDSVNDVFYPPQPYPSWTLNTSTWTWVPPVPYPADNNLYKWDEDVKDWVAL